VFNVATFERDLPQGSGNGLFGDAPHHCGAVLKGRSLTLRVVVEELKPKNPEDELESRL